MTRPGPRTIRIAPPVVSGQTVSFSWSIDPDPGLYRENGFSITLPGTVDLTRIPEALWLRVAMVCLHTHLALLRPCRVLLPRQLPEEEREFWLRLIDAAVWTLESMRLDSGEESLIARTRRCVELDSDGRQAEELPPAPELGDQAVVCFSGGRDSLALAATLKDAGLDLLLATTVSHRAGSRELATERFHSTLTRGAQLLGGELLVSDSNLRSSVENGHPLAARYGLAVTELTDVLLYLANALAIAWARGARSVFLAHEFDAATTTRIDGMVLQSQWVMYSHPTIGAWNALLAPAGVRVLNPLAPLQQHQIQRLLRESRPDLWALQYSCFMQQDGEDVCSRCAWCFKSALHMLSGGGDPAGAGIDLERVIVANAGWRPGLAHEGRNPNAARRAEVQLIDDELLRAIRALGASDVARFAPRGKLSPEAVAAWESLRRTAFAQPQPAPSPGYRARYLEALGAPLAERIEAIMQDHFEREPEANYSEFFSDARLLEAWITAPLGAG
jgi:7-cyano-7-deazaguanine synthase in queuosine biosynthesis